ncbi:hypothetical protein PUN28_005771 [Cardiocondyla obscurior]|uniref:Uncharacterized protein n=1 Tax=Cardiocondyla obscurior TaxID=286306 RepID=A0AAW2G940_9HYME
MTSSLRSELKRKRERGKKKLIESATLHDCNFSPHILTFLQTSSHSNTFVFTNSRKKKNLILAKLEALKFHISKRATLEPSNIYEISRNPFRTPTRRDLRKRFKVRSFKAIADKFRDPRHSDIRISRKRCGLSTATGLPMHSVSEPRHFCERRTTRGRIERLASFRFFDGRNFTSRAEGIDNAIGKITRLQRDSLCLAPREK